MSQLWTVYLSGCLFVVGFAAGARLLVASFDCQQCSLETLLHFFVLQHEIVCKQTHTQKQPHCKYLHLVLNYQLFDTNPKYFYNLFDSIDNVLSITML
jgi:hypothetical protein